MKKTLLVALTLGATATANITMAANMDPEQSRQQLVDYFKAKHPNIKFEDYRLGAYNFSEDKKLSGKPLKNFLHI